MKTINLHNTLRKYNEVKDLTKEEELILAEAKNIISNSEKTDIEILKTIGMANNIITASKIENEISQSNKFKEVYDISTIRKLAIDYRLRFLPSNLYIGTIDPLLPSKIKNFMSENNLISSTKYWEGSNRFYILAPASSFKLEKRPKDPIIFYKINDRKYAFVHKWGNDFSIFRKFKMFFLRTGFHMMILPLLLILSYNFFAFPYYHYNENNSFTVISIALSIAGIIISFFMIFLDTSFESSNLWDSKYGLKD